MKSGRLLILCGCGLLAFLGLAGQRSYAPSSILVSGNWHKLGVQAPGVYKIDIPFLNSMGINTSSIPSSAIRLFGNGGQMLSEANNGNWIDDLKENAIQVVDGGDGQLNGNDYIMFYANGPDEWIADTANQSFSHRKNLYSNKSYYFLSVSGNGKRVQNAALLSSPVVTVTSFSDRHFHELDTVNFLSSGKEWYGEEMSNLPGRSLTRNFNVTTPQVLPNATLQLRTHCVARSVTNASRFEIRINNQPAGQLLVNSVSGQQYDLFAQQVSGNFSMAPAQANNSISFTFVPGSMNAQGWLNWFELFTRRSISLNGVDQLLFRDWSSVGNSRAEFVVSNASTNTRVWDITDPINPQQVQGNFSNAEYRFVEDATRLREYVAFNSSNFLIPTAEGTVANQNLHGSAVAEMLIVTHPFLLSQAEKLASIHRQKDGLQSVVVTTEQVFNEFASGSPDPVAIRDFAKMYWDRYGANARTLYLLLFGDASFDYKNRLTTNTNLVPAYQNNISLDPLSTYTSDDFFGFLDDNEDINSGLITNLLDLGIGRVPARNISEARNFVDKVDAYYSAQSLGPWRNNLTFLADDEDGNLHLQDAEIITATAQTVAPVFNLQKIYLDAYRQESGPGGSQYPQANQASNNSIYNGTLLWNYNGHGGPRRLAEETILDQEMVNSWNNPDRLPLFITATCDFAPFDNPTINSLGENILLRHRTGAIALMTTTRLVFSFSNRIMNNNYIQFALQPDANGRYKTLGEAIRAAKNFTYQTLSDIANNRKFALLGDPALRLGFPEWRVKPTRINGINIPLVDTLSATEMVTMEGEVTDQQGNLLTNFNGTVYPALFDKPQTVQTLGNDPTSPVTSFTTQSNVLFRGRAAVSQGRFSFSFKVPKDINYQFGNGKLSLYAENGSKDANGFFTGFIVGGTGVDNSGDTEGPEIKPYLNDEMFVNGGLTNQAPVLILRLLDSSGINTTGTGIGHDIVATLDNDNRRYFILNDFYQGDVNSYQKGSVRFQLPELEPGPHTLRIKAWDVLNNSSEVSLDFIVGKDEELELSHVLNYPNPFTSHTSFWFEHNKPGQPLQVHIQVMTITGRIVKSFSQPVITDGTRSASIEWDGKDDHGDRLGRGVYLYRLRVIAGDGKKKEVIEKLVIL